MRIIAFLLLTSAVLSLPAQDLTGEKVTIRLNNLEKDDSRIHTNGSAPSISIVSPVLQNGFSFTSSVPQVELIGKAIDPNGISLVSINSEMVAVNEAGVFTTRLNLKPGQNRIKIMAMDNHDNLKEHSIFFEYRPTELSLVDRIVNQSVYYALIIGIEEYVDDRLPDLTNPINDCEQLHRTLVENYTFKEENIILLKNASRRTMIRSLDELVNQVTPHDNLLIYYAGHGLWDEKSDNGYWLPSDAEIDEKTNWVRNSAVVDYLKEINSKHTLLIADACFGGSIFQSRSPSQNEDVVFEKLYELPSRKAMTSGALTEVPDRSSFTKYLIERLESNSALFLSSEQLFSSFRIAVIRNSDAIPQYGDISNVGDQGGDFIFLRNK